MASAAVLVAGLSRLRSESSAGVVAPLVGGVLALNGIGLIVVVRAALFGPGEPPPSATAPAEWLSLLLDTGILACKFGWLAGLLLFWRRLALPPPKWLVRRSTTAVLGAVASRSC